MLDISTFLILFASGLLAGVCNAVAGGGTFFTFPVFLALGLDPVVANASSAVAVWPGHALAVVGYRKKLQAYTKGMKGSIIIALCGGIVGALLLSYVGNKAFARLIPFLVLFATLLFTFGKSIAGWLQARNTAISLAESHPLARVLEFMFAVYGSFFGAGLGIMLMAGLLMLGVSDVQVNNALKNLLAAVITSVALVIFTLSGLIEWGYTLVAFSGAVVGGLTGARLALILPAIWLRRVVIMMGFGLSVYYFVKYYGA